MTKPPNFSTMEKDQLLAEHKRVAGEIRDKREALKEWFFMPRTKGNELKQEHDDLLDYFKDIERKLARMAVKFELQPDILP